MSRGDPVTHLGLVECVRVPRGSRVLCCLKNSRERRLPTTERKQKAQRCKKGRGGVDLNDSRKLTQKEG